ncbi:MAG: tRNA-(ms[2]io[6]A)-hydroxylase [Pseudomonadota bacterium]
MEIKEFLLCETPAEWIREVNRQLPALLIDHANCEKKAASTALNLMYRYVEYPGMLLALSRLAREELRHFEQVLQLLARRGINYVQLGPAGYAAGLRQSVRTHEPARLVDILIVSAIVEARSCERFAAMQAVLDAELADFYGSLLESEARHFGVYLGFARQVAGEVDISDRIAHFLARDRELVLTPDTEFRFHSGIPVRK